MRLAGPVFLIAMVLCVASADGQNVEGIGLSEAVAAALAAHPGLKASRLDIEQAGNRRDAARAERAPRITVAETMTAGNNPVFAFGSLLEQGRFGAENFELSTLNNPSPLMNFRTEVTANLPVLDGRRTSSRIAQADIEGDIAASRNAGAEQQVRFEVLRHYFGLILAEEALTVAAAAVRSAEADVQRARDRVDAGVAVDSDLLGAQVQLAEFRRQRIQAEGERATALAALNIVMGSAPNVPRAATFRLVRKAFDVADSEELYRRALARRADYRQSELNIDLADRRTAEQRDSAQPKLSVYASTGYSGRHPASGSADYTIGAGITFDLLDRGRPARLAQAHVDKQIAEAERAGVADRIRLEVVGAYHRYRTAVEQIDVAQAALSQAVESLRIVQDRYEAGLTTITELLRAETSGVRARLNVLASLHDQYLGYARVQLATGELDNVRAFEP